MQRRNFIHASLGAATVLATSACAQKNFSQADRFAADMRRIETATGGRLGVAVLDTATGTCLGWREDERFPLCSTFKTLAAGLVLARVDRGEDRLERRMPVRPEAVVPYSPATQPRAGGEPMSLAELCEAAITLSDNTAGNLLLESFGGPPALTAFARSLGDTTTRLDRWETELNEALPGDPRDTTSPRAMADTVHRLALGDGLSPASRAQLIRWLRANRTGDKRLRALLPPGWQVGDKTGSGERGTANDTGLLWPPGGSAPLVVASYLTGATVDAAARDQALAEVGRAAAARMA